MKKIYWILIIFFSAIILSSVASYTTYKIINNNKEKEEIKISDKREIFIEEMFNKIQFLDSILDIYPGLNNIDNRIEQYEELKNSIVDLTYVDGESEELIKYFHKWCEAELEFEISIKANELAKNEVEKENTAKAIFDDLKEVSKTKSNFLDKFDSYINKYNENLNKEIIESYFIWRRDNY